MKKFGVPPVVAINKFVTDTDAEDRGGDEGVGGERRRGFLCNHWAEGSRGIEELAHTSSTSCEAGGQLQPLYADDMPLWDKVKTIATSIYGAAEASRRQRGARPVQGPAEGRLRPPADLHGQDAVLVLDRPQRAGRAAGHTVPIREVRLAAGAEFIVVICGEIMTMPGLPKVPSAELIRLNDKGQIEGLF